MISVFGQGTRISLQPSRVTIGVASENVVQLLQDDFASRHHAQIVRDAEGTYRLQDCGSSNGSFIKITDQGVQLRDGDEILIGTTLFRFTNAERADDGNAHGNI
ncbi:MAG: FHA domain-containing protein [Lentisphaerae bacterium]|nr:FHA domain-containing protein [Lentisphaerota bacterium]